MQFAHKPSFASFYDSIVLSIEFAIKDYIETWGQTFGTPDFITPIDPPWVVTNGFPVKNYTGFCYRGIFIID